MQELLMKYSGKIDFIDLKVVDISGRLRHVMLPGDRLDDSLFSEGVGFDASNFGYAAVEDSDMIMVPDPDTAFIDPFYEASTLSFLCDLIKTSDGKPFMQYPRNVLKSAVGKLESIGAAEAIFGPELEFHIFEGVSYDVATNGAGYRVEVSEGYWNSGILSNETRVDQKAGYHRCPPADSMAEFRNEVVLTLHKLGVPVKYHHHEVSSAQHEIELLFQKAVSSADSIVISKYVLQNLAYRHGLTVTFMPKPLFAEAGNGMHVHQFLRDSSERNLFSGDEYFGLSSMALSYTAGILFHSLSGSLLAFGNPSTNSYRRLVPGFEAPICAVFARGNRSAAVRIPGYVKDPAKARIEYRTIDASCNPYYGMAAMLCAGIDGVKQKMNPSEMGFGPIESNIYNLSEEERKSIRFFPSDLKAAINGLVEDNIYLQDTFPGDLISRWTVLKEKEIKYVNSVPSPAEFKLYYDL